MTRQTLKNRLSLLWLVVIFASAYLAVLTGQAGEVPMTSMKTGGAASQAASMPEMAGAHDEAPKVGSAQMETGPATIDVSAYPKAVQDTYLLFTEKCAQCHHLNHTINSDHHALPDEWKGIVTRMWHKPGSNINNTEAKQIVEFLTYDSSVRRKAAVDEMLAKATPKEKKADEDKIKEVHAKYDQH